MTPERLREIRELLGEPDEEVRGPFPVEDAAHDLLAERLRRLPVIATCGMCAESREDACSHPDAIAGVWGATPGQWRSVDADAPPPEWCPLPRAQ